MAEHTDKRTGRHRLFNPHAHLDSVTKHRHPAFTARHLEPMKQIMRDVYEDSGAELAEFSGKAEHVHLLVNFPPTVAISQLVNSLQGRLLPQAAAGVPRPAPPLAGETSVDWAVLRRIRRWTPISVLRQYIEQQERPPGPAHVRPPSPPA